MPRQDSWLWLVIAASIVPGIILISVSLYWAYDAYVRYQVINERCAILHCVEQPS